MPAHWETPHRGNMEPLTVTEMNKGNLRVTKNLHMMN